MRDSDLKWDECEPIVRSMGCAHKGLDTVALDTEDMVQEASLAALRCIRGFDSKRVKHDRSGYVRRAIKNHFSNLRTYAHASKRCPQLIDECDLARIFEDLPEWYRDLQPHPDEVFDYRELAGKLHERLPHEDWDLLVHAFVEGAHWVRSLGSGKPSRPVHLRLNLARAHAAIILNRIGDSVDKGERQMDYVAELIQGTKEQEIPECHANSTVEPQGYDRNDATCHQCPDKFTCFPAALDQGRVDGQLSDDTEVAAVLEAVGREAQMAAYERGIERMKRRLVIIRSGGEIPADLMPSSIEASIPVAEPAASTKTLPPPLPSAPEEVEPEEEVEEQEEAVEEQDEAVVGEFDAEPAPETIVRPPKRRVKPTPRKKKSTKKQKKQKKQQETKRSFPKRRVAKTEVGENGKPRGTMHNGKPLPPVRELSEDQMVRALERVRIGQDFKLELGMQIVRKKRDGELVVTLRDNGFEMEGTIYSSLSTAAMYAERRIVSANAFFNLTTNKCTEVRDEWGKPIAGYDVRDF